MDYISRITPPVCEQEPGSVHKHIKNAIQAARNTTSNVVVEKVFKEAYALFDEYRNAIPNSLFDDIVKNGILENPNYTPLHGMVMACLCAAFGQNDEALKLLVVNVEDHLEFVYFKSIIDYYRSKRILDDYADKERIEYIKTLEMKEMDLCKYLEEYRYRNEQLQEENEALKESLSSKQENILTLEDILDYMRNNAMTMDTCERIVAMLNHFSSSFTEDGQKQVHNVSAELRNDRVKNVVNHNHIEGSYVIQGVMKDSKFSK